ncbi:hypothetical protein SDRG_06995 [Saprolegnia diclina VS20]|uniref:Pumilio domain-containing protein NOP9 n=1 Tax=Saprolegnia diclina (strain VS20) TaxID=1156394 RepID=T0RZB7_SAPDV|nr:hypothetical protein SDRG_06995 [Saprolegnia diclina VS20]EQC35717.1 hypothetical protein SDRG_06995 [Saprolegnia diclina VS20]|eukprot:XP_008611034.1 hypothetical protein SDRG_06995 [Saprolegnia diclina VS20]
MADETHSHERPERVRPRRLEPDTTAYLLEVKTSLLESLGDDGDDTKSILLWNVLEELAPRIASAASDRHACEIVEVLVEHMSPRQLSFFVHKMEGYYSHLWTNRYSSHVLQRILSKVGAIVQAEVDGSLETTEDDDERSKNVPTMAALIVAMCTEVKEEWITLVNDVSASHVLRGVLCALAGRAPVAEKRGKKGKHGAVKFENLPKKSDDEKLNAVQYTVPETFTSTLTDIVEVMMDAPDDKLAELMFDHHAGPFLSIAVRVCPDALRQDLVFRLLNWDDEESSKKRFYDYAGDTVASHFLEALCQTASEGLWTSVFDRCMQSRLLEFSEHAISNYVVQNFISHVPNAEYADLVLDEMKDALWTLLSMHRPGVIWRLAECCVRFKLHFERFFNSLTAAVAKQESKKPAAVQKDVVPALIALELSNSQNAKLSLNVAGARIVETLLQFPASITAPLVKSILGLNGLQLVALSKDSVGSRCLVEPIWNSENDEAKIELFTKFKGQFGTLAMDRNGAFSVIKCFNTMSLEYKTMIAEELSFMDAKLVGNHFASMVLTNCNVHEFKTNEEKWRSTYERKRKVKELFSDLVDETSTKMHKKHKKDKADKKEATQPKAKKAKKAKKST